MVHRKEQKTGRVQEKGADTSAGGGKIVEEGGEPDGGTKQSATTCFCRHQSASSAGGTGGGGGGEDVEALVQKSQKERTSGSGDEHAGVGETV